MASASPSRTAKAAITVVLVRTIVRAVCGVMPWRPAAST